MSFEGARVKGLVLTLRDRFPGAELVFDADLPIHVRRHNLQISASKIHFRTHWDIWHGKKLEGWGDGIRSPLCYLSYHRVDAWAGLFHGCHI